MNFSAYQDTNNGIAGVSVVSSGHIFAQKGRKIERPSGRPDYLLFYIAKGKEHFFLEKETVAPEGSFIFFRPFEKQEHIYTENETGEFYYVHFKTSLPRFICRETLISQTTLRDIHHLLHGLISIQDTLNS